MKDLDPRALRDAFGRFPTGVTVVTARTDDGTPVGFTANSFSSVSLDPPMLLVCPGRFLSSFDIFQTCGHFGVSVLAEGQEAISNTFARSKGDRFDEVDHWMGAGDIPLISGAAANFSCKTMQTIDAGDHVVLLGQVLDYADNGKRGLGYVSGQYFSLGLERHVQDWGGTNLCGAIVRYEDFVLLERTKMGLRPPISQSPDHASVRDSLYADLTERGVTARLGSVYSIFDNADDGAKNAYLLAQASAVSKDCALEPVKISDLAQENYASSAIEVMMKRYGVEAQTSNFALYLGDSEAGGTHKLSTGT